MYLAVFNALPKVLSVIIHDIYYGEENTNADEPPVWIVSSGSEFTLDMENVGALEHNWAILCSRTKKYQCHLLMQTIAAYF